MPAASPVTVPVLAGASELSAVEVRFDGAIEPKRDSESAKDRQEAVKVGREIAMAAL